MTTYTLVYPPEHTATYVKSTTEFSSSYALYKATNPANSLTGGRSGNCWVAANLVKTNQRLHIDLGEAKIIRQIYYENSHESGTYTNRGANNFTFWGSNEADAFATLTYATDTDWTQLTTAQSTFDQHVALDQADPKFILVTNTTAYRYYAFKIADAHGGTQLAIRRLVLMTEDGYGGVSFISRPIFF
jgi:hypothetical protein